MRALCLTLTMCICGAAATAQPVLFDFDNAPLRTPLPITLTVGGITAHMSADPWYYNYSVQSADVLGFTPVGFAGRCIYPNAVFKCDLLASFSVPIQEFSILYAVQDLYCDSAATMRVTVYMDDAFVATTTFVGNNDAYWPTSTLAISTSEPFNKAVVHYETPPACGDWGPIFMADNMRVTPAPAPCAADFNGDGSVNTLDVLAFLNAWSAGDPSGDFNGDGTINTLDVLAFLNAWSAGC
jgi:hypothetical protein